MQRIVPVIRNYAWGSRTALADLAGRPSPTSDPEAELWVGAHEASPAFVPDRGTGLDGVIAEDTDAALGESGRRFDGRLPFLLKILAADKALSIQAHPTAERARSATGETYADEWPKPEAWVPLEECEAFIGSLPFDEAAARLTQLDVAGLTSLVDEARNAEIPAHALLSAILRVPQTQRSELVRDGVAAVEHAVAGDLDPDVATAWRRVLQVHEQFPGDIGVVVLLTMQHHVLVPGTSTFLAAGVLHTFVSGTTIEVLANSDNVVRAGLTDKAVDVDELLEIVDVEAQVTAEQPQIRGGLNSYPSRCEHFALHEIRPAGSSVDVPGQGAPTLVLAVGGHVVLASQDWPDLHLAPLEAAWISADHAVVSARGEGEARLFVATPGHAQPGEG